ncbi:MAG: RDD family protein [Candidatus Aminicenantes bacterium]|nr:RDD family protein [Candidatus Aminicenantes bacterium]
MIRSKTVIASPQDNIWRWLMEPANWKLWDNGDLQEVIPGWQAGATMRWAIGLPSKLASYQEGSVLGIESAYLLSTIGLNPKMAGTTEVEIIEVPLRGASFSDAGAGRIAQLDKNLAKLKQLMESREAFLGPLTAEEKLSIGNLPFDVYEIVIREKTSGAANLVSAAPGPDAFWRLQEQLAILRKQSVGDIRRLKESVAHVMEADLVARGGRYVSDSVIVAKGGDTQALVRGAELYSVAARFNPYNDLALMSCGVALARAGYHREAVAWLSRAHEVNPGNERISNNLKAIRADAAKAQAAGSTATEFPGGLPDAVKPEAIPAFDLVWPPTERPAPIIPKRATTAGPQPITAASYASPWVRLVAFLIDGFILIIASAPLQAIATPRGSAARNPAIRPGWVLAVLALWWLYFALMESSPRGATLGKRILGLRVTDMNGRRIGFGRATGRFFVKVLGILTFYIGYALAVFTPKKQALHDLLSRCLVVKAGKS